MLEGLSDKFQRIVKRIRGEGTLTESNMEEALGEVRLALLERRRFERGFQAFLIDGQPSGQGLQRVSLGCHQFVLHLLSLLVLF